MKNLGFVPFLIIFFACNKSDFSPVIGFKDKLTVYCILDSRKNVQLVKVQRNYPSAIIPDSLKILKNVKVKITVTDGSEYNFKDTTINEIENFSVFYFKNMPFKPGGYLLEVSSDGFPPVWGTVNPPYNNSPSIDYNPDNYRIYISLNPGASAYTYRVYAYYKQRINDDWVIKNAELPVAIQRNDANNILIFYPRVIMQEYSDVRLMYKNVSYVMNQILSDKNQDDIIFLKGGVIVYSFDWNFLDYFKVSNGFIDQYSVRLDVPNWTNLVGGYGVFGVIRADSTFFPI